MKSEKGIDRIKETLFQEEMNLGIEEIERLGGQILKTLEEKVFRARGIKESISIESLIQVDAAILQLFGCIKEQTEYMQMLLKDTQGHER